MNAQEPNLNRPLIVSVLAVVLSMPAAASASSGVGDDTTTSTAAKWQIVGCGSDRLGGLDTEVPASWTKDADHSSHKRCVWVAPGGHAKVVITHVAQSIRHSRAERRDGPGAYSQAVLRHVDVPSPIVATHWKLWKYSYTSDGSRRNFSVIGWHNRASGPDLRITVIGADAERGWHRVIFHHIRKTTMISG